MSHLLTKYKFPPEKWPYLAVGLRLAELVPTIEADGGGVSTQLQSLITHWVQGSRDQEQQHYWFENRSMRTAAVGNCDSQETERLM